jgi:hypothetical protein
MALGLIVAAGLMLAIVVSVGDSDTSAPARATPTDSVYLKAAGPEEQRRLFDQLQAQISSARWQEAQSTNAALKAINANYAGRTEAESIINAHLRTLEIEDAIKRSQQVVADGRQCKEPKAIADAWSKLKTVTPSDVQWRKATATATKLESCRLKARSLLDTGLRQVMILQRTAWVQRADTTFLDKGMNVTLSLSDANKDRLRIQWALMSRAAVYQFTKDGSFLAGLQKIGFERVTFADGFDESYYFDLHPEDESHGGNTVLAQHGLDQPLRLPK